MQFYLCFFIKKISIVEFVNPNENMKSQLLSLNCGNEDSEI